MIIINLLWWVYSLLQGSNIDVILPGSDFLELFSNIMSFIGLVLPLGTVKAIIIVVISLASFRVIISLFKTLWAIIPLI